MSDWCSRVLAEQGGLIGMPIYNKVLDFAMEFYSNGRGRAVFAGYSLFTTNDKGGYMGNRLLRNESIERCIEQYVSLASLVKIREYLQKLLGVFYIGHTGYLGVDMMVCLSEKTQSYAIFPCVEVNVRMNMGVVSRLFFDNFMLPSATGTFCVEAFSTHAELQEAHENDNLNFPAVVRDGKLLSGYLSLAPVTPKSRYRAYVKVEE